MYNIIKDITQKELLRSMKKIKMIYERKDHEVLDQYIPEFENYDKSKLVFSFKIRKDRNYKVDVDKKAIRGEANHEYEQYHIINDKVS